MATETRAYTVTTERGHTPILLQPRRYARFAGLIVLVPLLPQHAPLKPLPAEVWRRILMLAMSMDEEDCLDNQGIVSSPSHSASEFINTSGKGKHVQRWSKWDLALVCKELKDVALPLLYSKCTIRSILSLSKFTALLYSSDQKWDSIRRIPYSTPGRWVLSLSMTDLEVTTLSETRTVDDLLSTLFPLLPFLSRLELSLSMQLSRRAMSTLGLRDGAQNLRCLRGVKYDPSTILSGEDPLSELIACCSGLEELEVVGIGVEDFDTTSDQSGVDIQAVYSPLYLPHLHTLTILATPSSPLLHRLIYSSLPSLRTVVITPYGDIPAPLSVVPKFLAAHGQIIRTLVLHTPKSWPIIRYPPPRDLLCLMPKLSALSLESTAFAFDDPRGSVTNVPHSLRSIWISRPTIGVREELLRMLPSVPRLKEVRVRDVRWAKPGLSARAREAGFQGEMLAWKRLLGQRGIRLLDADGSEDPFS